MRGAPGVKANTVPPSANSAGYGTRIRRASADNKIEPSRMPSTHSNMIMPGRTASCTKSSYRLMGDGGPTGAGPSDQRGCGWPPQAKYPSEVDEASPPAGIVTDTRHAGPVPATDDLGGAACLACHGRLLICLDRGRFGRHLGRRLAGGAG